MQTSITIMVLSQGGVEILKDDGELIISDYDSARKFLMELEVPPVLIHSKSFFAKLQMKPVAHYELLELFAFACPAEFCIPTLTGLIQFLDIKASGASGGISSVPMIIDRLLQMLRYKKKHVAVFMGLAESLHQSGWGWGEAVLESLKQNTYSGTSPRLDNAFSVWEYLTEWQETGAPHPASDSPVGIGESDKRLGELLGADAEMRHSQHDYCSAVTKAFTPKHDDNAPNMVLAEGGTGIGKTYGYLAPATLWAETNGAPVWVSTYTRNLQHQIYGSLEKSYGKEEASARSVIRKGRENYLCLLNYAGLAQGAKYQNALALPMALMGLWILHSRDGDLKGDGFPSWLTDIIGRNHSVELADRRGECIYSACQHYRKCFIESSIRKARQADIVIANHALMIRNFQRQYIADEADDDTGGDSILRTIFDEGHHLFNSADSAFSAALSGFALADLHRWLSGGKSKNSTEKGLQSRMKGLLAGEAEGLLFNLLQLARCLPDSDWLKGRDDDMLSNTKSKSAIEFLRAIYRITNVRSDKRGTRSDYYGEEYAPPRYSTTAEMEQDKLFYNVIKTAQALHTELQALLEAVMVLREYLLLQIKNDTAEDKGRMRRSLMALQERALEPLQVWLSMLEELWQTEQLDDEKFSWFAIQKRQGKLVDTGYYSHYINPMEVFSEVVLQRLHGGVITSATLTDDATSEEAWQRSYRNSGVAYLQSNNNESISHHRVSSPFDYKKQAGVIVINDLDVRNIQEVATAFGALFSACGGGAMGIFTAIKSLTDAYPIIQSQLAELAIPLYAQHIDDYHLPDLIQIFKSEVNSCLLGTDALRDGVDVPGKALRLVVFDKVPWQRRSLLLKARCQAFGKEYDEMLARLALRQAFGRLIRNETDKGLFVILDKRLPSKLIPAFPEGIAVQKMPLTEAVKYVNSFLI